MKTTNNDDARNAYYARMRATYALRDALTHDDVRERDVEQRIAWADDRALAAYVTRDARAFTFDA